MQYSFKDLWELKGAGKIYAGRARPSSTDINIAMTRKKNFQSSRRAAHNRELRKEERMIRALTHKADTKEVRKHQHHNRGPPQVTRPKMNKGTLEQKTTTNEVMTAWDD